jgi:hypothetical protein
MAHLQRTGYPQAQISAVRTLEDVAVHQALQQLTEETAKAASAPLWPLTDDELHACLRTVHRWEQAVAAMKARLVREAASRGVPSAQGHRTTAAWLRADLLLDPAPAAELADRAAALNRHPAVEQAMVHGRVDARQAAVIAAAVAAIPADLEDVVALSESPAGESGASVDARAVSEQAESALLDMATRFPAYILRRLGDRILSHVAPEIAEEGDEAALRRQEARAHARRHFTLSLPEDGVVRVSGLLGVEEAAVVQAALHPLCAPIPGDDRNAGQRRADALIDICRLALRTTELPDHGGEPPQVTVTVPFDPLTAALGTAVLDSSDRLSAAAARRIACDARILPLVLGGAGQVLDAGRTRRLATGSLRRALVARDRGCAFPDCDRPARWCDAHHLTSWLSGGGTDLGNLVLLCRHHHRLIHDPDKGWQVRMNVDQLPEFVPPHWVDPDQVPRQNEYHPRI